jgi:hypothetical protein
VILPSVLSIGTFNAIKISSDGIDPANKVTAYNWAEFPEFFGFVCYAIEGIGTVIPVRNTMKDRHAYRPVFILTMAIIGCLCLAFGVLGCLCYGKSIKDIIFFNFPSSETFFFTLQMVYGLSLILTFPIYVHVCSSIIFRIKSFREKFETSENAYWNCTAVRSLTTFAIFGLSASGVDILDLFVFSGAFCNSYLAMILPCLLYMRWFGIGENKLARSTRLLLWSYMVLG